jgi:hypothetical protein
MGVRTPGWGDAMKRLLALGCLLCAVVIATSPIEAATADSTFCLSESPPPKQLTAYEFAKATLASLWYARNGANRGAEIQQATNEANNPISLITAWMRINKTSTNDFVCAQRSIAPFINGDKNTAVAAKFLVAIYDAHIDLNNRANELLKKLQSISQEDFMDQISTLQVERDQRYADLVRPAGLAFASLIDLQRTDNPNQTTRLIITVAQKQALVKWANDHFVEFTNGTPEKEWADPAKTAHMTFDIFKGRKCSDE